MVTARCRGHTRGRRGAVLGSAQNEQEWLASTPAVRGARSSSRRLADARRPAPDAAVRTREQRWDARGRALRRTSLAPYLEVYRRIRYEMFLIGAVPKWALLGTRCAGRPRTGTLPCMPGQRRSHVCATAGALSGVLA